MTYNTTVLSRVTQPMPLVKQELLTREFIPIFNRVHVAQSLVFYLVFCRPLFVFLTLSV